MLQDDICAERLAVTDSLAHAQYGVRAIVGDARN